MQNLTIKRLNLLARQIKLLTLEISYLAKTGHVGSCLSIAELLTVLYFSKMNIGKQNISSPGRDRFILSKGHAAAVLYTVLFKKGIITKKELLSFGQDGGLCEHPEITQRGIEMSTGSLGHGLAFGAGIALGNKIRKTEGNVYVLISDGECGEGSVWEAAAFASRMKLDNLVAILDYNDWQCFGRTSEVTNPEPVVKRWQNFGFATYKVDGHSTRDIKRAFQKLPHKNKPSIIIAHTVSGRGVPLIEDKLIGHYKVFSDDEYKQAKKELELL